MIENNFCTWDCWVFFFFFTTFNKQYQWPGDKVMGWFMVMLRTLEKRENWIWVLFLQLSSHWRINCMDSGRLFNGTLGTVILWISERVSFLRFCHCPYRGLNKGRCVCLIGYQHRSVYSITCCHQPIPGRDQRHSWQE